MALDTQFATSNLDECTFVDLKSETLNVEMVMRQVTSEDCGAISLFAGITRNQCDGRPVQRLEYEAYEPMAKQQLRGLAAEMRRRWPTLRKIALIHRLGHVPVSEASVVIAASSPHRQEALESVQFAIDRLKAEVAIWKKEIYQDGCATWKANSECEWADVTSDKK